MISPGVTARLPRRSSSILRGEALAPSLVLFAIMVAHALLETARDALLLARIGPDALAWAYLAIAGTALLAVGAVRRWGGVRDPRRVLLTFLTGAVIGTTVLAATITAAPWVAFILYVWTGLVATLVVPCFWTVLDRSLRIGEAKRVFGMIGAGGVLGAMVGSAIASGLGRVMPARHLVTAGAIAFVLAAIAAFVLAPRRTAEEAPPRRIRADALSRRSRRYIQLIIVVTLVSTVALTLGDLTFKRVIAEHLPPGDLAMVFGAIYTGLNLISLVIQLAVTPRLLAKWGVAGALTVLPVILVGSALGFVASGAVLAIVVLKLGDGGLRNSLHRVGSEILYLPVPSAVRDGWKPVADAIGQRGGQALAALLVFAMAAVESGARTTALATAIAGLAWVAAITIAGRAYIGQFREMLKAGEIQRDVRIPDLDASSIEMLTEALSSPDEVEALAALDLLARRGRVPALVLYHPRERVVRHALLLLEGELRPDVARVLGHLREHPDPKIRAAALAASGRIGCPRDELTRALADPDADVRAAALVALAGDAALAHRVDDGIEALLAGTTADRLALAHAIGFAPSPRLEPVLYRLLDRREPAVRRQVLHVLGHAPERVALDRLIRLLDDPHVRGDVRDVFTAIGPRGLDWLSAALDDPRTPVAIRRHLPRTISRFRSRAAVAVLTARLPREPDGTTEFKILRAIGRLRAEDPTLPIDADVIRAYARRAVADAARYATLLDRLDAEHGVPSPGAELIRELLAEKRRWAIEHAFRAFGILHPRAGLRSVHDAILGENDARQSAAREIFESLVPIELREPLLAIIDDVSPARRRHRLGALAPGPFVTYEAFVVALLADPSDSLRCIVAHHVAERGLVALRPELTRLRPMIGPPLVVSAFDQAIARLDA